MSFVFVNLKLNNVEVEGDIFFSSYFLRVFNI